MAPRIGRVPLRDPPCTSALPAASCLDQRPRRRGHVRGLRQHAAVWRWDSHRSTGLIHRRLPGCLHRASNFPIPIVEDAAPGVRRYSRAEPFRGDAASRNLSRRRRSAARRLCGWGEVDADAGEILDRQRATESGRALIDEHDAAVFLFGRRAGLRARIDGPREEKIRVRLSIG